MGILYLLLWLSLGYIHVITLAWLLKLWYFLEVFLTDSGKQGCSIMGGPFEQADIGIFVYQICLPYILVLYYSGFSIIILHWACVNLIFTFQKCIYHNKRVTLRPLLLLWFTLDLTDFCKVASANQNTAISQGIFGWLV